MYKHIKVLLIALCTALPVCAQFDIPAKPSGNAQTSVYDYASVLTAGEKQALEQKLIRYADSTSTQIVVITITTSKGEELDLLGARWGQAWGIGQAGEDNGVVVILAKDDRKIDINTGYGIEYRITDRQAKRIIEDLMIPQFRSQNYTAGLNAGADAIFSALKGEFKETREFKSNQIPWGLIIIFIFFIFVMIASARNKKGGDGKDGKGGIGTGSTLLDILILSNLGRGGFGGGFGGGSSGGFGGGGFGGGFGGGGFGGGGASGGW